jgi:RNA polymerase sigma factor (sigma-70 family)
MSPDSPFQETRRSFRAGAARPISSLRERLLAKARKQLNDPDDAEDACQEALLRTWAALRDGRCSSEEIAPYSFGVLRNVLHEVRRSGSRDVPLKGTEPRDPTLDPASGLVRQEVNARVRQALDELPSDQRRVAMLTLADDVTCSEVARAEGVPAATVRKRKHRARNRLMKELQGLAAM